MHRYLKNISIGLVIVGNLLLWIFPSNVVDLIARDRHTILGRYSLERFTLLVVLLPISLVALYLLWATRENIKKRIFQVVASLIVLVPGLLLVDWVARFSWKPRYTSTDNVYHRMTQKTYKVVMNDVPEAARSYPNLKPGYPPLECTLTTDHRGFRNSKASERYEIVTLGDSFTEGSHVSDEHAWPVLLGEKMGGSVYNLGMSGTDVIDYAETFQKFGSKLGAKIVVCMIYEGNDFRQSEVPKDRIRAQSGSASGKDGNSTTAPVNPPEEAGHRREIGQGAITLKDRFRAYYKTSPFVLAGRKLFIQYLAPIGANGPVKGIELLSWLPLAVPEHSPRYYAFAPKGILYLYQSEENFSRSPGWLAAAYGLEMLKQMCERSGIRMVVVYAPTKAHVVLPLLKDRLPMDKVRDFTFMRKKWRPEVEEFKSKLFEYLPSQEKTASQFCKERKIEFVTLTQALRDSAAQGTQVYFSYDQHWTPPGHAIAAEVISRHLSKK